MCIITQSGLHTATKAVDRIVSHCQTASSLPFLYLTSSIHGNFCNLCAAQLWVMCCIYILDVLALNGLTAKEVKEQLKDQSGENGEADVGNDWEFDEMRKMM